MKTIIIFGGDGYLGWSLGLALASRTDDKIILIDNYSKRKWQEEVEVCEIYPIENFSKKIDDYKVFSGKDNMICMLADISSYLTVEKILEYYKPDIIYNLAHQPSAIYSMMSPEKANFTIHNNNSSCLNVLWAVAKVNPEILVISIGSAGSFLSIDSDFIPKMKVNMHFKYNDQPHTILNSWLPMQASDFYHQSKVMNFGITELCVNLWNLKVITVQQSTVFGCCIPENKDNLYLSTRFSYDEIFGTVFNRFIVQAVINQPLTVYGDGLNVTGLCSLSKTIDRYIDLSKQNIIPGKHAVEYNFCQRISIIEMAIKIANQSGTDITHIKNPRIESDIVQIKEFELDSKKIDNQNFDDEIQQTFDFCSQFRYNIRKEFIYPKIQWGG